MNTNLFLREIVLFLCVGGRAQPHPSLLHCTEEVAPLVRQWIDQSLYSLSGGECYTWKSNFKQHFPSEKYSLRKKKEFHKQILPRT